jgi:hypothetical protein
MLPGTSLQLFVVKLAKNVKVKLNMTQSLCVSCGRKTLSLTLSEKHELSVFRNTLLRVDLVPLEMRHSMAAVFEASLFVFATLYLYEQNAWFIKVFSVTDHVVSDYTVSHSRR